MALGAILGAALNTGAAHIYGLFLDGLDVVEEPVNGRYGVPLETVHVTEAAPGNVSTMSFVIDDPQKLISIATYCRILFWDFARDLPIFAGFVQSARVIAAFGQQGRSIEVTCYGIEAVLDQVIIPSLTTTDHDDFDGTKLHEFQVIERLAAYAPVRVAKDTTSTFTSSFAFPIQDFGGYFDHTGTGVVLDGMSIRQAFETWLNSAGYANVVYKNVGVAFTVDFWGNARGYWWGGGAPSTALPSDYAALTITETSTPVAASLTWEVDTSPQALVTQVYVKGGDAATTGWVVGDTTQGPTQGYVSAPGISVFSEDMISAANTLLGRKGTAAGRGTLVLEDYTPTNLHPGSLLTITNAALGWTAKQFVISQIDRDRFTGDGRQTWRLTFFEIAAASAGGQPSAMDAIRTLTRSVAN